METLFDLNEPTSRWALALTLGFPILLLAFHELSQRLSRRGSRWAGTVRGIRTFLLPAAALALFLRFVVERPAGDTGFLAVVTILWIVGLWILLGLVDGLLFSPHSQAAWRANIPALFRDVVRSLLVGVGAAVIYSQVWGQDFAGALAALGLGSLVLGLALQEPLGNVFSGIMLLFERPVKQGDWLQVDGRTGKVTEMNWRSVGIETVTQELLIVPNSALYKQTFANLSRPTALRTEWFDIGFGYNDAPGRVKAILTDLLESVPGILKTPAPVVRVWDYKESTILYRMAYSVESQEMVPVVRDNLLSRLWYVCQRHNLNIPYPIAIEVADSVSEMEQRGTVDIATRLAPFPDFIPRHGLDGVRFVHFTDGETILTEGDPFDGLLLVTEGRVSLSARNAAGHVEEAGFVEPGGFLGENSILAGQESPVAAHAVGDAGVVRFDLDTARALVDTSPSLARQVGETIEIRRRAVSAIKRSRAQGASAP